MCSCYGINEKVNFRTVNEIFAIIRQMFPQERSYPNIQTQSLNKLPSYLYREHLNVMDV